MPSPSECLPTPDMIQESHQCVRTSSRGHHSRVISHAFTSALHLLISRTIILPCSTDIPFSFNALFTLSIHPFLSTSHLSHQILLFSLPTGPSPFSPYVQTTSTHYLIDWYLLIKSMMTCWQDLQKHCVNFHWGEEKPAGSWEQAIPLYCQTNLTCSVANFNHFIILLQKVLKIENTYWNPILT